MTGVGRMVRVVAVVTTEQERRKQVNESRENWNPNQVLIGTDTTTYPFH
jgi:hypothetical protein